MLRGFAFLLLLSLGACSYDNAEELLERQPVSCDLTVATYALTVSPLLDANCRDCHNRTVPLANINLEGYEQAKLYADNGKLMGVISHAKGFSPMPKGGAKLSDCEISRIQAWVDAGARNN